METGCLMKQTTLFVYLLIFSKLEWINYGKENKTGNHRRSCQHKR